jgi:hypothetical protein
MLSVSEALKILNQKGKKYTVAQAKEILNFLYQLAEIAYLQYKISVA